MDLVSAQMRTLSLPMRRSGLLTKYTAGFPGMYHVYPSVLRGRGRTAANLG